MNKEVWKIAVPFALVCFVLFSKWWYVLPVDAPATMMTGFPFIYLAEGWHTSMSFQLFLVEFLANLVIFYLAFVLMFWMADRFIIRLKASKILLYTLYIMSLMVVSLPMFGAVVMEKVVYITRPFDLQVLDSGYTLPWDGYVRPQLEDYVLTQQDHKVNPSINWFRLSDTEAYSVTYVSATSNPYLGGNYSESRIVRVTFIDTARIVEEPHVHKLLQLIKDPVNIKEGAADPFIVQSGFIFQKDEEVAGTINFSHDFRYLQFEPPYRNQMSWQLTDKGVDQLKQIINELKPGKTDD